MTATIRILLVASALSAVATSAKEQENDCQRTDLDESNVLFLQIGLAEESTNSSILRLAQVKVLTSSCRVPWLSSYRTAMLLMVLGTVAMFGLFFICGYICRPMPQSESRAAALSPKPQASEPAVKMLAIEGVRAVWTLQIVFFHAGVGSGMVAHAGMQFFLITSGFVNMLSEDGKRESFSLKEGAMFFLKRFARLCPLYYLALFCEASRDAPDPSCATAGWGNSNICALEKWPLQAVFAQTLLPWHFCSERSSDDWAGIWQGPAFGGNMVGWFMADLLVITLFFPVFFNWCPERRINVAFLLAAVVISRSLLQHIAVAAFAEDDGGEWADFPYAFIPLRALEFVAGMVAARFCRLLQQGQQWPVLARGGWGLLFDTCVMVCVAVPLLLGKDFNDHGDTYLTGVCCVLCVAGYFGARARGRELSETRLAAPESAAEEAKVTERSVLPAEGVLGWCLSNRLLQGIATYSYPLYLFSWLCVMSMNSWLYYTGLPYASSGLMFAVYVVIVDFVLAISAQKLFQEPIQRLMLSYLH